MNNIWATRTHDKFVYSAIISVQNASFSVIYVVVCINNFLSIIITCNMITCLDKRYGFTELYSPSGP